MEIAVKRGKKSTTLEGVDISVVLICINATFYFWASLGGPTYGIKSQKLIFPKMFSDIQEHQKSRKLSLREKLLVLNRSGPAWLGGQSSVFCSQKRPSQHLLGKFLSKALQKRSTSINIPGTNSYLCSVRLLLCRLSLFDFPIKAKLDLKGSAPLSKDLF